MTVLVVGATGNVGSQVMTELLARGVRVRAVSRRERSLPEGVEGVVGDPGRADGLDHAVQGVTGVFMLGGYAAQGALLEGLRDAHVVLLSSSSADLGDAGNAMGAMHLDWERAVRACGLTWTFLRPCSLQSNLLRVA